MDGEEETPIGKVDLIAPQWHKGNKDEGEGCCKSAHPRSALFTYVDLGDHRTEMAAQCKMMKTKRLGGVCHVLNKRGCYLKDQTSFLYHKREDSFLRGLIQE